MDRSKELTDRFAAEPLAAWFGLKLVSLKDGRATISMTVLPGQSIVGGIAQGGVTTVLADYAGVYAAMTRIAEGHTPAKHIAVDLLRPAKVGETLTARAAVVEETRSTVFVQVRVLGADRRVRALASISFAKPKP